MNVPTWKYTCEDEDGSMKLGDNNKFGITQSWKVFLDSREESEITLIKWQARLMSQEWWPRNKDPHFSIKHESVESFEARFSKGLQSLREYSNCNIRRIDFRCGDLDLTSVTSVARRVCTLPSQRGPNWFSDNKLLGKLKAVEDSRCEQRTLWWCLLDIGSSTCCPI